MIQYTVNQFEWTDVGKVDYHDVWNYWMDMLEDFPEAYDEDWYPIVALDMKQHMVDWGRVADSVNRLLGLIKDDE